jgi:hypothetical protein
MRSHEVFARMTPEEAARFLEDARAGAPAALAIALGAAAQTFKLRPQFLKAQPRARQAEWMRKALSRPLSAVVAEEVLAEYFLSHRRDLLVELLDLFHVAHAEGALQEPSPPCPAPDVLEKGVKRFREGDDPALRELLLRAFAAQSPIDWPDLERLLA